MISILCLTPIPENVHDKLNNLGNFFYYPDTNKNNIHKILTQIKPYVLFVNPNNMDYKLNSDILQNSTIKCIATASTGTNHIDLDFCKYSNINILSLTTKYEIINSISSTAELAFGLTVSLIRNIPAAFDSVKQGFWNYVPFIGRQLNFLTVGIVGLGRLGKMYASYCKAFGMNVCFCDPYKESNEFNKYSLYDMLKISDVISLHVHLNNETKHLINANVIEKCKKTGVYIINTSRGQIVNENDIINGLKTKKILGYATDVLVDELGNINNSDLIHECQNLPIIITPHIGGMTYDGQNIAYHATADNLKDWIDMETK